jgi:hypothetical protein
MSSLNNPTWKILWNLNVPAKVKIFCWIILHGVIPLKAILFRRHIGTDGVCPLCKLEAEDMLHMMFKCPRAYCIWKALGLEALVAEAITNDRSGSEVFEVLLKSPSTSVPDFDSIQRRELIAVSAWYIWWLRRRQTHGEQVPPIRNCITSIRAITANVARANISSSGQSKKVWAKPRSNFLKLNVDAAFSVEEGSGASGAVLSG